MTPDPEENSEPKIKPSEEQLQRDYHKAQKNTEKQTECFRNVLADRRNMDDETFDSYCEEMQGALEAEERAAKRGGYY